MAHVRVAAVAALVYSAFFSGNGSTAAPTKISDASAANGSVEGGYLFGPGGDRLFYQMRSPRAFDDVVDLYSVPSTGGDPLRLNSSLAVGRDVSTWSVDSSGDQLAYFVRWSDAFGVPFAEAYLVDASGGQPSLLSGPFRGATPGGEALAGGNLVYVGSERANVFNEPYFELFSVPLGGSGEPTVLNGELVSGGDVRGCLVRTDGPRVLFLADQDADERIELYSVSASGGDWQKLNPPLAAGGNVLADGLKFSPNGEHVLYAANQDSSTVTEIYLVPTLGGEALKLNSLLPAGGNVTAGSQQFSPDGTRVLYHADQNADEVFEAFAVSSAGGTPVRLNAPLVPNGDVSIAGLQFSPDGQWALYHADQDADEVFEIFVVPSDGTGEPRKINGPLAQGGDVAADATFSPDNTRVLYRADQESNDVAELYLASIASGSANKISAPLVPGGAVLSAAFSPDGSHIVYLADQEVDGRNELYAVPVPTGEPYKISGQMTAGGNVIDWRFSPDGRMLVYRADQDIDGVFELYSAIMSDDLPGDYNHNGTVDAADYTVWRDGLSPDSTIEGYRTWKNNFGRGKKGGSASLALAVGTVPEPQGLLLLLGLLPLSRASLGPRAGRERTLPSRS